MDFISFCAKWECDQFLTVCGIWMLYDINYVLWMQRKVHEMLEGDLEAACRRGEALVQALRGPYTGGPSLADAFPARVLNVTTVQRFAD